MKCMIVKPTGDIKAVTGWLNDQRVSYTILHEEGLIFANLGEIPSGLLAVATVIDPVYERDGKWFSSDGVEESNGCDTEDEARMAFVCYISWAGEWVPN